MRSPEPGRLTDDFWLTAHDSVRSRPLIGELPLGYGLAAGLLAELLQDGHLRLRDGQLFRTEGKRCNDPALQPLLAKMAAEERHAEPDSPAPRPRTPVDRHPGWDRTPTRDATGKHVTAEDSRTRPINVPETQPWPGMHADHSRRPKHHRAGNELRTPGHDLGDWLSYLAYDGRAEKQVIDRLASCGLAKRQEFKRFLSGATVRYVPYDSVAAGSPATRLRIAVQNDHRLNVHRLDQEQLLLAGLFLATGLHHQALATLSASERAHLTDELKNGLGPTARQLLRAVDAAVGEAAMR